jgi:Kef-type K+ transport system membrane component KefB
MVNSSTEIGLILLEVGIIILFSLFTAFYLRKFKIPTVLGLILGGLILGVLTDLRGYIFSSDINLLKIFVTELALGFIGFEIGNKIDFKLMKRKGKSLGLVLLGEAFGAFILVTIALYFLTHDFMLASIFGSIAMATAPAATTQIIKECEAKGELTSTVMFMIAFDDILAILLVNISLTLGFLSLSTTGTSISTIFGAFLQVIQEIFISSMIGIFSAFATVFVARKLRFRERGRMAEWIIGVALLMMGIVLLLHGSVILTMFLFGMTLKSFQTNKNYEKIINFLRFERLKREDTTKDSQNNMTAEILNFEPHFSLVETLFSPVVLLFFVLIGLEMDLDLIFRGPMILILSGVYFLARVIGKMIGVYSTTSASNLNDNVRINLPFCLTPQAGVAIGLAGLVFNQLMTLGMYDHASLVINVVGLGVILSELIGPILVRKGLIRSGEVKSRDEISLN